MGARVCPASCACAYALSVVAAIMSLPRAFVEWGTDQVIQWLSTLQLSCDYAKQFRDHNIDGAALLRLNPSSLSRLGITDRLDRVKLLQQVTTMQADLASLPAPARQWRGSGKLRRLSENGPLYCTLATPSRKMSIDDRVAVSQCHSRPSIINAYPRQWKAQSVQSFSGKTSSDSRVLYSIANTVSSTIGTSHSDVGVHHSKTHLLPRMAHSDIGSSRSKSAEGREQNGRAPLRQKTTHLKDKKKRLSSSMDKLWEAQLATSPLPLVKSRHKTNLGMSRYHSTGAQFHDSLAHRDSISGQLCDSPSSASAQLHDSVSHNGSGQIQLHDSVQLVETLKEENTTLKRELEIYYWRVLQLMRLEQELDRIRESHRLLEESSRRRERLQVAVRAKLESELARLRRKCEQSQNHFTDTPTMPDSYSGSEKVSERRESVVKRRLQSVKSVDWSTVHATQNRTETDGPEVYFQRIDRLKEHLHSLQQISLRREGLETRVRTQLQDEIRELRGRKEEEGEEDGDEDSGNGEGKREGMREKEIAGESNWEMEVAVLQADLAKWEQKCTELEAEKELAVEVALANKETHINQLKEALKVKEEEMTELARRSQTCQCQLADSQRHIALLETKLSLLQASDTALQHETPVHHLVHSSPPHQIHSSPPNQSSPCHSTPTSTNHQAHSSPSHTSQSCQVHCPPKHHSSCHQVHHSPTTCRTHQPSPTNKKASGSMLDLFPGSATSHSSTQCEPKSRSDTQIQPSHITNEGDPIIITLSSPTVPNSEQTKNLPSSLLTQKETDEGLSPVINSSLTVKREVESPLPAPGAESPQPSSRHSVGTGPKFRITDRSRAKSSLPSTFTHDLRSTIEQPDIPETVAPLTSSTSPQHQIKRVKSKTPPPRSDVRVHPKNYKQHSSLDSGPPLSHTPSDLELFNTLLGDRAPDEMGHCCSSREVKSHCNPGIKGVNSLLSHSHANRV